MKGKARLGREARLLSEDWWVTGTVPASFQSATQPVVWPHFLSRSLLEKVL